MNKFLTEVVTPFLKSMARSSQIIVLYDLDGVILYVSDEWKRHICGDVTREVVGQTLYDVNVAPKNQMDTVVVFIIWWLKPSILFHV